MVTNAVKYLGFSIGGSVSSLTTSNTTSRALFHPGAPLAHVPSRSTGRELSQVQLASAWYGIASLQVSVLLTSYPEVQGNRTLLQQQLRDLVRSAVMQGALSTYLQQAAADLAVPSCVSIIVDALSIEDERVLELSSTAEENGKGRERLGAAGIAGVCLAAIIMFLGCTLALRHLYIHSFLDPHHHPRSLRGHQMPSLYDLASVFSRDRDAKESTAPRYGSEDDRDREHLDDHVSSVDHRQVLPSADHFFIDFIVDDDGGQLVSANDDFALQAIATTNL